MSYKTNLILILFAVFCLGIVASVSSHLRNVAVNEERGKNNTRTIKQLAKENLLLIERQYQLRKEIKELLEKQNTEGEGNGNNNSMVKENRGLQ